MNEATLGMIREKRQVFDESIAPYVNPDGLIRSVRGNGLHVFLELAEQQIIDASNNQALQVELLGRKRVLTGTVARNALRVHAPFNAPDVVWQALGKTIGEVASDIKDGRITQQTVQILERGGPSGLATRN
jgi:hypothetical protein